MFKIAARALRPATRSTMKPTASVLRTFSSTVLRASGGHGPEPPKLYGPGSPPGVVPTDFDQATGLERFELLGEIEGINVFDEGPLDSSRLGTKKDPLLVLSYATERIVGCTGSPADSHDVEWFVLKKDEPRRCIECGSFYQLDYQGVEHPETAHH